MSPFSNRGVVLAVSALVSALSGCGMNREHPPRRVVVIQRESAFVQALKASPASPELTLAPPALGPADAANPACALRGAGAAVLDETLSLRNGATDGEAFLQRCQALFACSTHGSQQQALMAAQSRPFRISFVDFPTVPEAQQIGDAYPQGLYLIGDNRVYLQQRLVSGWSTLDACGVLIHELYHLHDEGGGDTGGESLENEYPAHHQQMWFLMEAREVWLDSLGIAADHRRFMPGFESTRWTRDALARGILGRYGLASRSDESLASFLSPFDPFPAEAKEILLSDTP